MQVQPSLHDDAIKYIIDHCDGLTILTWMAVCQWTRRWILDHENLLLKMLITLRQLEYLKLEVYGNNDKISDMSGYDVLIQTLAETMAVPFPTGVTEAAINLTRGMIVFLERSMSKQTTAEIYYMGELVRTVKQSELDLEMWKLADMNVGKKFIGPHYCGEDVLGQCLWKLLALTAMQYVERYGSTGLTYYIGKSIAYNYFYLSSRECSFIPDDGEMLDPVIMGFRRGHWQFTIPLAKRLAWNIALITHFYVDRQYSHRQIEVKCIFGKFKLTRESRQMEYVRWTCEPKVGQRYIVGDGVEDAVKDDENHELTITTEDGELLQERWSIVMLLLC